MTNSYFNPIGGLPDQNTPLSGKAIFTEAYAVIPRDVMRDIVTSALPHWTDTRVWILARPLSGFAETFAQYIVEVAPGGGSEMPEPDPDAEAVLFVTGGAGTLTLRGNQHTLSPGSYAYIPIGTAWTINADAGDKLTFHWIRKRYEAVEGLAPPDAFVTHDDEATRVDMKHTDGRWSTTIFVAPDDLRHDMHVNIVNFEPGAIIPFRETHVMEHGLFVLEGKAVYNLNGDWIEVEAGDFMWLRAFCPQACYAGGPGPFRYLLYKDVNRHPKLSLGE